MRIVASWPGMYPRVGAGNARLVHARTDAYTAYSVTYRSGDLRVSGVLDVPHGRTPFVLALRRTEAVPVDDERVGLRRTYLDRVTEPVLIHHGTADESCPIRWSRATTRAMQRAGVDVRMHTHAGEPHAFIADWPLSMRRSVAFFRRHV